MILGFQWLDVRVLLECGVGSGGSNSRSMSQVSKEAWSGTEEFPGGVQSVFEV